jgi:hypothetical protein
MSRRRVTERGRLPSKKAIDREAVEVIAAAINQPSEEVPPEKKPKKAKGRK